MGFEWIIHLMTFLVLVSYRGHGSRYRMVVSLGAAALTGLSLACTMYSLIFPPPFLLSVVGAVLLVAVIRCRGNVAKLFRSFQFGPQRKSLP